MRMHLRLCLLILFIIAIQNSLLGISSLNSGQREKNFNDRQLEDEMSASALDIASSYLVFSETYSQDDGNYFACRNGLGLLALFGISQVTLFANGVPFHLEFLGSNQVVPVGEQPSESYTNYFIGNDSSKWKVDVPDYSCIKYRNLYQGIDLIYMFHEGHLKYDFIVNPHADPSVICFRYSNADCVRIEGTDIVVIRSIYEIRDTGLVAYQKLLANEIQCSFNIDTENRIGIILGRYDSTVQLIIDPTYLAYCTYLGGTRDDIGYDIAVEDGYMYIVGETWSTDYPTYNSFQSTFKGSSDCFVTKIDRDGKSVVFSTLIGGTDTATKYAHYDVGYSIAVEDGFPIYLWLHLFC